MASATPFKASCWCGLTQQAHNTHNAIDRPGNTVKVWLTTLNTQLARHTTHIRLETDRATLSKSGSQFWITYRARQVDTSLHTQSTDNTIDRPCDTVRDWLTTLNTQSQAGRHNWACTHTTHIMQQTDRATQSVSQLWTHGVTHCQTLAHNSEHTDPGRQAQACTRWTHIMQ